jgi:hypothetical protein
MTLPVKTTRSPAIGSSGTKSKSASEMRAQSAAIKVAVIALSRSIVTDIGLVSPLAAPLQPPNVEVGPTEAVSQTVAPAVYVYTPTLGVTVPTPEPVVATAKR